MQGTRSYFIWIMSCIRDKIGNLQYIIYNMLNIEMLSVMSLLTVIHYTHIG